MAEALYRKYRPQVFDDVVGQEHIEQTIKNAIEQDKVSHAYLFTGPRGTGKTTTARLLSKALLCEKGPTPAPDGTCEDCQAIANGEHPDVYELDAASRTGVENVREEIIGRVQFAPTRGRYKIYIIDEVHMLSTAAFNALLKTLEEPPSHVVFILATTDPQKVPETIHSRCQRFDFHRISQDSMVARLGAICVEEGVEFEGEALDLIAHRAEGGMRNALTSLEQLIAFGGGRVTLENAERMLGSLGSNDLADIMRHVGARDVAACFRWTAEYVETGADLAQFARDFAERVRNMYVMSLAGSDVALAVSEATRAEMVQELEFFGPDRLARMLGVLGDLCAELKTSINPRLSFEIALTRMVRPQSDLTLESLAERIEQLERNGVSVSAVVAPAAAAPVSARGGVEEGSAPVAQAAASAAPARAAVSAQPAPAAATTAVAASAVEAAPVAAEVAAASAVSAAPAASSQACSSALAGLANPAALQRMWQTALTALKKEKAAYGVLFMNTKVSYDEASAALVIEFAAANSFAFNAVRKPDVQSELARILAGVNGAEVPFSIVQEGGAAAPAAQIAQVARTAAATATGASQAQPAARTQAQAQPAARTQAQAQPAARTQAQAQPAQAARSVRQERPEPARAAAPAASEPSYYDEVPVDMYDDMAGYDDIAPWESAPPRASEAPRSERPAAQQPAVQQLANATDSPAAAASATDSPAAAPVQQGDLNAILAFGFGDGVRFEEV